MKRGFVIVFLLLLLVCIWIILFIEKPKETFKDDFVHVYFLNTVEADSIIIMEKEHVILIDTGEDKDRALVLSRLRELGIEKIDMLILTHPDKDHIGNALEILKKYPVSYVYQSGYKKGSHLEEALKKYIEESSIPSKVIDEVFSVVFGSMEFAIYPPESSYDSSNNDSLVTTMRVGNTSFFFGADIKKKRVNEMLKLSLGQYDVVKVPYHGRYHEKLIPLLEVISPSIAVITGSKEDKLVNYFKENKINDYYTYENEIHVISDGNNISVK